MQDVARMPCAIHTKNIIVLNFRLQLRSYIMNLDNAFRDVWHIMISYDRAQVIIVSTGKDRLGPMVHSKRKILEMSQEELAVRLDKSTGAVGQLERGETMPGIETLQTIIDALNLDPRVLSCDDVPNDRGQADDEHRLQV